MTSHDLKVDVPPPRQPPPTPPSACFGINLAICKSKHLLSIINVFLIISIYFLLATSYNTLNYPLLSNYSSYNKQIHFRLSLGYGNCKTKPARNLHEIFSQISTSPHHRLLPFLHLLFLHHFLCLQLFAALFLNQLDSVEEKTLYLCYV